MFLVEEAPGVAQNDRKNVFPARRSSLVVEEEEAGDCVFLSWGTEMKLLIPQTRLLEAA